jgi:hypothetical protein
VSIPPKPLCCLGQDGEDPHKDSGALFKGEYVKILDLIYSKWRGRIGLIVLAPYITAFIYGLVTRDPFPFAVTATIFCSWYLGLISYDTIKKLKEINDKKDC